MTLTPATAIPSLPPDQAASLFRTPVAPAARRALGLPVDAAGGDTLFGETADEFAPPSNSVESVTGSIRIAQPRFCADGRC